MNPFTEQLYYNLLLFTLGCSFLAFFYHFILYLQRREELLLHYWVYLFFLTGFLISRVVFNREQLSGLQTTSSFHFWDELLQLLLYYSYIEFIGRALGIHKKGYPVLYKIWKTLGLAVLVIALSHSFLLLFHFAEKRNLILTLTSRVLLISVSLLVLITFSIKKNTPFQKYILAGAFLFLVFGALALISDIYVFEIAGFYAVSFTFLGEIADVLLFSAAMGYRLRQTYEEKEKAMKELEEQRELVRKKDIEKIRVILETRHQERNRIARELHDEVGSTLSSIHIFSTVAQQPDKTGEMIRKIKDTSARVMENMSDLVWAINSETDDTTSLLRRIRQFGSALLEAKNTGFEVLVSDPLPHLELKTEAKKNILLICKEAVNNIAKYASASKALIEININDGLFVLTITDNGCGFEPRVKKGNGLTNMEQRCSSLGGKYHLITAPGAGTRIQFSFLITTISN